MSDEIRIDTDVLSHHAHKVLQLADDVVAAQEVMNGANLSGDAFGSMFGRFIPSVAKVGGVVTAYIRASGDALHRTGLALQDTADDFDRAEQERTALVHKVEGDTVEGPRA